MTDTKPRTDVRRTADDCCGHKARREETVDEALTESFPASDPPAFAQPAPQHERTKEGCCCSAKTKA